jgi:hypothetical protein
MIPFSAIALGGAMKRTVIHLAGLGCYAVAAWSFYKALHVSNIWFLVAALVLIIGGVLFTVWGLSDNIYNVQSGTVIRHNHADAYHKPLQIIPGAWINGTKMPDTIMPAQDVPEQWGLLVRDDRGREGWLNFTRDVHPNYPINSQYP